jgi:hypothetical protein
MITLYHALARRSTGCVFEYVSTQNVVYNICLTCVAQLFNQHGNCEKLYLIVILNC